MIDTKLHSNTALLLFARSEAAECAQKFIATSTKKNALLWKTLNSKTLSCIQKTALPYFFSNETTQIGSTFGEKLTHAISEVFKNGYEKVIVIGNDCPQLTSKKLLAAARQLQNNDFVFGPDFNGGLYLTGISKKAYNIELFLSIPWQTDAVFETIIDFFSQKSLVVLEKLIDVNSAADLKYSATKINFKSKLTIFFTALLSAKNCLFDYLESYLSQDFISNYYNKGSPLVAFTSK